jgi:hypothetical protein
MWLELAKQADRNWHSLQYSAWICENCCAMPANKSNTIVVSEAIVSISKTRYRDDKWKHKEYSAFLWLVQQIEHAQMRRTPINHLFFLNGDYNSIDPPEKKLEEFVPCGSCNFGWINVEVEGKDRRVTQCDCRKQWIERVKKS